MAKKRFEFSGSVISPCGGISVFSGTECQWCSSLDTKLCPVYTKQARHKTGLPINAYVCKKCCKKCWKNKLYQKEGLKCDSPVW